MTNFECPASRWFLKKKHKGLKYFKRRRMTEIERVQCLLGVSDEEMKHYVPGTFRQEDTEEGINFTGIFKYSFGSPDPKED